MALIDVTKESLKFIIDQTLAIESWSSLTSEKVAEAVLNYYTPIPLPPADPVVPLLPKPSAFAIKDVISNELIWDFTSCRTEKECRVRRLRYFPTAQYKVVKLYEAVE